MVCVYGGKGGEGLQRAMLHGLQPHYSIDVSTRDVRERLSVAAFSQLCRPGRRACMAVYMTRVSCVVWQLLAGVIHIGRYAAWLGATETGGRKYICAEVYVIVL